MGDLTLELEPSPGSGYINSFSDWAERDANQVWQTQDDPLAMSCASHDHWRQTGQRWQEVSPILPHHREQARVISTHYRDKIMMQMLGSRPLSEFKRDLYHVLTGGQLLHRHRGMIWKLPYFYAEDQAKSQLTQMFRDHEVPWNFYADLPTLDLTPVVMIMVSRRGNENQEFWFRDQQGSPVLWRVDVRNPLISLVRGLWQRPGSLRLRGAWRLSSVRSGCRHVIVHMPELVHD